MPADRSNAGEWLARIERMIDEYSTAKRRQLLQQAMKSLRRAEAQQKVAGRAEPPERAH